MSGGDSSLSLNDWTISSHSGPISSSSAIDDFHSSTKAHPPEMIFLENHITIRHAPTGTTISFNTADAIRHSHTSSFPIAQYTPAPIKVTAAALWTAAAAPMFESEYDWTFTNAYRGTTVRVDGAAVWRESGERIDVSSLGSDDAILYYSSVPLFDDELHDSGHSGAAVKCRVMSKVIFILYQSWMRVDNVRVRLMECRVYHRFGSNQIIREWTARDADFQTLRNARAPTANAYYNEPSVIQQKLPVIARTNEVLLLSN